ncbi:hypothetical protein [Vibrio sp. ED002]|uniref:hypothetical protein n=1 Tax=Vibrio sp. ED002 TaxID=2785123 RepID=UPI00200BD41F|nr:hypothetical protein [Vibrio sp. ED002]UQA50946.1 hypothetical protein ITG12_00955 [Vibrio sp. ED002]
MEKFEFRSVYFWLHTSFSAVSIAFFLSLLSAQPATTDTFSIKCASVLFCISVILNAGLSIFLALFGNIKGYVNRIYHTLYPWNELSSLPAIAIYSFILGIIFLFSYYSWFYALTGVIAILYAGNYIQSQVNKANEIVSEKIQDVE